MSVRASSSTFVLSVRGVGGPAVVTGRRGGPVTTARARQNGKCCSALVALIQMTSVKSSRLSGPVRPQPLSRTPPIGAWISSCTVGRLTFTIPCKGRLHRGGKVVVLNIVAGHHLGRNE